MPNEKTNNEVLSGVSDADLLKRSSVGKEAGKRLGAESEESTKRKRVLVNRILTSTLTPDLKLPACPPRTWKLQSAWEIFGASEKRQRDAGAIIRDLPTRASLVEPYLMRQDEDLLEAVSQTKPEVLALYQADQKVIITFNVCNSGSCDPQLLGIDLSQSDAMKLKVLRNYPGGYALSDLAAACAVLCSTLKLLKELNICKISEAALVQPMDDKKQHSRSLSVPFHDEVQFLCLFLVVERIVPAVLRSLAVGCEARVSLEGGRLQTPPTGGSPQAPFTLTSCAPDQAGQREFSNANISMRLLFPTVVNEFSEAFTQAFSLIEPKVLETIRREREEHAPSAQLRKLMEELPSRTLVQTLRQRAAQSAAPDSVCFMDAKQPVGLASPLAFDKVSSSHHDPLVNPSGSEVAYANPFEAMLDELSNCCSAKRRHT